MCTTQDYSENVNDISKQYESLIPKKLAKIRRTNLEARLGWNLLHGILRQDTPTGIQVDKALLAIHLLHGDRANIASNWLLVVVGQAGRVALGEGRVGLQFEGDDVLERLDVLTNEVAIAIGGPVEQKFKNGVSIVELSEATRDDGGGKSLLGEGAGEPLDSVEDVLVDLGSLLLLLDEFVSLWN